MKQKVRISRQLKEALKNYKDETGLSVHHLAVKLKTYPAMISYLINDTMMFIPGDKRVLKIAKVLGFTGECFEE